MRILTEVEMFPKIYNWILESDDYDLDLVIYSLGHHYNFGAYRYVTLQWYERPNEDNLLNTLTEALEGAYDYD